MSGVRRTGTRSHVISVRLRTDTCDAAMQRAWDEHRTLSSLCEVALLHYLATTKPQVVQPGKKSAR